MKLWIILPVAWIVGKDRKKNGAKFWAGGEGDDDEKFSFGKASYCPLAEPGEKFPKVNIYLWPVRMAGDDEPGNEHLRTS